MWGNLYADDARTVSKSAKGIAKMMTVTVTVFEATGLTVSEQYIDGHHAATNTGPDIPGSTARHRSSWAEV